MYNSSSIFAVNYQARAICAQKASTEKHRFIVGTCSLHDQNEISVLQYSEDTNHFEAVSIYSHPDQIWCLESSPTDPSLIISSRQSANEHKALTLWKMPYQEQSDLDEDNHSYSHDILELSDLSTFNESDSRIFVNCLRWHPRENKIATVDNQTLITWDIKDNQVVKLESLDLSTIGNNQTPDSSPSYTACTTAWDPHNRHLSTVTYGDSFHLLDARDQVHITGSKSHAHQGTIRDIDYNPNKTWTMITAGDDRKVKFWDIRKLDKPLLYVTGHSHWIMTAKYNPFHDQLLLSGGTDNIVNLWRIASCSSTPWIGHADQSEDMYDSSNSYSQPLTSPTSQDEEDDPPNIKIRAMDQHEDAVYGVAWSPADAWIYCSLSYDGRAIINHVPSTEKYKILL